MSWSEPGQAESQPGARHAPSRTVDASVARARANGKAAAWNMHPDSGLLGFDTDSAGVCVFGAKDASRTVGVAAVRWRFEGSNCRSAAVDSYVGGRSWRSGRTRRSGRNRFATDSEVEAGQGHGPGRRQQRRQGSHDGSTSGARAAVQGAPARARREERVDGWEDEQREAAVVCWRTSRLIRQPARMLHVIFTIRFDCSHAQESSLGACPMQLDRAMLGEPWGAGPAAGLAMSVLSSPSFRRTASHMPWG